LPQNQGLAGHPQGRALEPVQLVTEVQQIRGENIYFAIWWFVKNGGEIAVHAVKRNWQSANGS